MLDYEFPNLMKSTHSIDHRVYHTVVYTSMKFDISKMMHMSTD